MIEGMSGIPRITIGVERIWVRTPMHRPFNAALKDSVPYTDRWWDDTRHCWRLHINRMPQVQRVLFKFWETVQLVQKGKPDRLIDRNGREVRQETLFT
jgi:hypothetical protein